MTITEGYPQTNRKIDTGKTLKRWPVLVDHYTEQPMATAKSGNKDKFAIVATIDV